MVAYLLQFPHCQSEFIIEFETVGLPEAKYRNVVTISTSVMEGTVIGCISKADEVLLNNHFTWCF